MEQQSNKIRAALMEGGYTIASFSRKIGVSESALRRKIEGKTDFRIGDIRKFVDVLKLKKNDVWELFLFPEIYVNAEKSGEADNGNLNQIHR